NCGVHQCLTTQGVKWFPGNRNWQLGLGDHRGETPGDTTCLLLLRGLDHDSEELLGAGGAQQHTTGPTEFLLGSLHGSLDIGVFHDGGLVGNRHIDEDLRQHGHRGRQLGKRLAGLRHAGHERQTGEGAVTGGAVIRQDDVTRLLATERIPTGVELLQDITVATLVVSSWMSAFSMASFRPRLDMTVATRVFLRSSEFSFMAIARMAMISSPSTMLPSL